MSDEAMTTSPLSIPSHSPRTVIVRGLECVDVPAKVMDRGDGTPVVFLHGLVGLNDHWMPAIDRLSKSMRTTAFELPLLDLKGEDCSIHGATHLTAEYLRSNFSHPPILVGNSFGGHVALKIALEHPNLCGGLVLAGASGLIEKSMVSIIQTRPSREWLERKIGELFFDSAKMSQGDVDRAFAELNNRAKAFAMVKLSRSARKNHLGEEIHRISVPTLIIWGRQDIVTPVEAAEEFKAKIPDSELVWFDRCGHAPMIECAEDFANAIEVFIRGRFPAR